MRFMGEQGLALEVASGTGQHVTFFAAAMRGWRWQPSDPDLSHRRSIDAWVASERLSNVEPAIDINVLSGGWPPRNYDVVFNANMVHIAPWDVAKSFFDGLPPCASSRGEALLVRSISAGKQRNGPWKPSV